MRASAGSSAPGSAGVARFSRVAAVAKARISGVIVFPLVVNAFSVATKLSARSVRVAGPVVSRADPLVSGATGGSIAAAVAAGIPAAAIRGLEVRVDT